MGKKHPAGIRLLAPLLLFLLAACLTPLPAAGQEEPPEAAPAAADQAAEAAPAEDAGDAGEEEEDVEYTDADFDEILRYADHIVRQLLNSL